MIVGVLQFELLIHDASSLKDKRRVVRSLRDRLHRDHLVAFAEVGALDKLNLALCAVSAVGADAARIGAVLDRITTKLRAMTDAELAAATRELITIPAMGTTALEESDIDAINAEMIARAADGGLSP